MRHGRQQPDRAALLIAGVPLIGTLVALALGDRHHVGRTGAIGLLLGVVGVAAIVGPASARPPRAASRS